MSPINTVFVVFLVNGALISAQRDDVAQWIYPDKAPWGRLKKTVYCQPDAYAVGFKQRVEQPSAGDDTALNALELTCKKRDGTGLHNIRSDSGAWGTWSDYVYCANDWTNDDFLYGVFFRIESNQLAGDDTAVNDARFICLQGSIIGAPNGGPWGDWKPITRCPEYTVICGFRLIFEDDSQAADDTGANGAEFACCRLNRCSPNPCSDNTPCVQTPGGYQCNCTNGKQGTHCVSFSSTAPDTVGVCILWGDPHLKGFHRYTNGPRIQYLCTESGTFSLLNNKLINATITIADQHWFTSATSVTFYDIDIDIGYSYEIDQSTGLCIRPSKGCEYEPGSRRRKRSLVPPIPHSRSWTVEQQQINDMAEQICQAYIDEGTLAAWNMGLPVDTMEQKYVIEDIQLACIFDTRTTGIKNIGSNSIRVLLSEGKYFLPPKNDSEYTAYVEQTAQIAEEALVEAAAHIDLIVQTLTTTIPTTTGTK
ncbi:unnamed protein product [Didymodactylos carnosus]|uniref:EGF-like domain-containing protein n=1 Tax=Didymodactylos carnosus TaxID=1234261 RepID=A0A814TEL9_9BILA|nr:unnamed protein product [Didymodactylos carnosus]CAF1160797.1 unnamed protein product [Didymodactylos carnosus]CAF3775874.1 unnamed protein product [Didymodactylos carnosus]CAF3924360.1 unnamed protein product [Didymodactylos carnosus]